MFQPIVPLAVLQRQQQMKQQNKLLYESCKKSMTGMPKQGCPLLTPCATALEKPSRYSCFLTANKIALGELIFLLFTQFSRSPGPVQPQIHPEPQPSWLTQGRRGLTAQGCSSPPPATAGARRALYHATRQPLLPSLHPLPGLF